MLRFLRIRNLAVIEAVEVEFEPGFNVLTGETGAGKSILVEAVGLLLGARASADLVRTGEALATIEAIFDDPSTRLARPGHAPPMPSPRTGQAAAKPGEGEERAAPRRGVGSGERIQRLCQESCSALYDSDEAVFAGLGGVWKRVDELATIEPQFGPYVESRDGIKSQLEDLAFFLRSYADGIDASPGRLQQVEDRLALIERLKRKYGPTLQEVIDKGAALARERELLTGAGEGADALTKALEGATSTYLDLARGLSRRRRAAAVTFARELEALLAELAMARTRFEVRFNEGELPEAAWSERGIDQAEFFVSPNPGEDLRPLT